jgi:hypothetical protein
MPRQTEDADLPGHDSFLDIVANMVGILIILVMVVGVRVKNSPVLAAITSEATESEGNLLDETLAQERALQSDVLAVTEQIRDIEQETTIRHANRELLARAVAAWQYKLKSRRQNSDAASREVFDLGQAVSGAKSQIGQLDRDQRQVEAEAKAPVVVQSYPTPLSETVDGDEIHFQLLGGRIAYIPLEDLVDRFKSSAKRQVRKLLSQPELTDTVGPIEGFRMRYTIVRQELPREEQIRTGHSGMYARLQRWTLVPVSGQLGEMVDVALAERSRFRRVLSGYRPDQTTITIWAYEGDFSSCRKLKEELYLLGFNTAARPLPAGTPISGSPQGSRSAAQ